MSLIFTWLIFAKYILQRGNLMNSKMKKIAAGLMILGLLTGCSAQKKPTESRVNGKEYTFNASEFKNYYNNEVGEDYKLGEFDGEKIDTFYLFIAHSDDYMVTAQSDTADGKLTEVSISYSGGEKSGSFVKYSDSEMRDFEKYCEKVFYVCGSGAENKTFKDFFEKTVSGNIPPTASEKIGDLDIQLEARTDFKFTFKPNK